MRILHGIMALLLAIVIANPACCCTLGKPVEVAKTSHCCGGGKKKEDSPKHGHEACACAAHQPKQLEDPPALPNAPVVELPPLLPVFVFQLLEAPPVKAIAAPVFYPDTGPPARRLALYQRFLI